VWWLLALAASVAVAMGATPGGAVAGDSGVWSSPITIVPSSEQTSGASLSVSAGGSALAAWLSGPVPAVYAGPSVGQTTTSCPGGPAGQRVPSCVMPATGPTLSPPYRGRKVVADLGTASGGLGAPVVLNDHGDSQPDTAISGSGVGYVAWEQYRSASDMISVERDGRFSPPRQFLPAGAQLVALEAAPAGSVFAAWLSSAGLAYARLNAAGQLDQVVMLSKDLDGADWPPVFAVNDRGALAAAWIDLDGVKDTNGGSHPSRLQVVVCTPAGRCKVTPSVPLFPGWPHYLDIAVALTDGGTASVLADDGANGAGGVRAAVSRDGGPFSDVQLLASPASYPVARADGPDRIVVVIARGSPGTRWFAYAELTAGADRFSAPRTIPNANGLAFPEPALATDPAGASWSAGPAHLQPPGSLRRPRQGSSSAARSLSCRSGSPAPARRHRSASTGTETRSPSRRDSPAAATGLACSRRYAGREPVTATTGLKRATLAHRDAKMH
jgi:hypothetical protein